MVDPALVSHIVKWFSNNCNFHETYCTMVIRAKGNVTTESMVRKKVHLEIAKWMSSITISCWTLNEDLPTIIWLLPSQNEESEGTGLKFIFVEGKIFDDHWLLIGAGKFEGGVSWPRRQWSCCHIRPECLRKRPKSNSKTLKKIIIVQQANIKSLR